MRMRPRRTRDRSASPASPTSRILLRSRCSSPSSAWTPRRSRRRADQTMEIYAPPTHRLGSWQIKWELEDLAFKYLEPEQYKELAEQLAARRQVRERYIDQAMKTLASELEKAGVRAELSGRAK